MTIKHDNVLMPVKKVEREFQEPALWKVIFLNDDYTPIEFVYTLLELIYKKTEEECQAIALKAHSEGSAVVSVYPKEVAETKKLQTNQISAKSGYPLRCEIEEDTPKPSSNKKNKP